MVCSGGYHFVAGVVEIGVTHRVVARTAIEHILADATHQGVISSLTRVGSAPGIHGKS